MCGIFENQFRKCAKDIITHQHVVNAHRCSIDRPGLLDKRPADRDENPVKRGERQRIRYSDMQDGKQYWQAVTDRFVCCWTLIDKKSTQREGP